MATPSFLTEYELVREKQLAKNAKKMQQLGIFATKAAMERDGALTVGSKAVLTPEKSAADDARNRQRT